VDHEGRPDLAAGAVEERDCFEIGQPVGGTAGQFKSIYCPAAPLPRCPTSIGSSSLAAHSVHDPT
jgi:hypothetical protein